MKIPAEILNSTDGRIQRVIKKRNQESEEDYVKRMTRYLCDRKRRVKRNSDPFNRMVYLEAMRERTRTRCANETPKQREKRLKHMRDMAKQKYADYAPEEREKYLEKNRVRYHKNKKLKV